MTKIPPTFVPLAVLMLGFAVGGAYSLCAARQHPAPLRAAAITPAPHAIYPVRETRAESDSELQIEGMSEDAENTLVSRTDFYFHHGDYPRIIALDRIVTELDPEDVETYSTGGWLLESDGDNADAEAYYSLGMTRNPTSSYAAYSLATFYFDTLHDYPKAETVLLKSTQDPDADDLDWKLLAHTYEHENRYDLAVATWKIIQRKFPKSPAIQSNLSRDEAHLAAEGQTATPAAPTVTIAPSMPAFNTAPSPAPAPASSLPATQ